MRRARRTWTPALAAETRDAFLRRPMEKWTSHERATSETVIVDQVVELEPKCEGLGYGTTFLPWRFLHGG